jgi:hypothetical protein
MASKLHRIFLLSAVAAVAPGMAQVPELARLDPATSIKFDLPKDAPLQVESFDSSDSRVSSRAGALVIDLHVTANLRNTSGDYIRSITLLLQAQESPAGGRMSKAFPIINAAPNEVFTVPIDGRLMRPVQSGGPLVRILVDGVLFQNYMFYGPDRLNSRRQMVAWAMQSDRDRNYFKQVLQTRGPGALRQEMLDSLNRQLDRPHLDVQLAARGRTTTSAALAPNHIAQFAFLQIPESPIKPTNGSAEIAFNEARSPKIEIENTSKRHIRYVEIAWLVKDLQGQEYLAASVPASSGELYLPPGRSATLLQDTALRFTRKGGQPVDIQKMTGFVSEVEYSDGNMWIPKRETLQHSDLLRVIPPSPEEQHLADVYHRQSLDALVRELNKF